MNKAMPKHIFQSLSIDNPKGYVISREDLLKNNIKIDYPYVLKPINEGSSIGVHIVSSHEDHLKLKNMLPARDQEKEPVSKHWDDIILFPGYKCLGTGMTSFFLVQITLISQCLYSYGLDHILKFDQIDCKKTRFSIGCLGLVDIKKIVI